MIEVNVLNKKAYIPTEDELKAFEQVRISLKLQTIGETINFLIRYGAQKAIETLRK